MSALMQSRNLDAVFCRVGVHGLPAVTGLAHFQALANRSPPQHAQGGAPVQRKILIADTDVLPGVRDADPATLDDLQIILPCDSPQWAKDGYYRDYKSQTEFSNHASGQPGDVGLVKKCGVFFRIKHFSGGTFFALGEYHAAYGYRDLIKETHHSGKDLGEGS